MRIRVAVFLALTTACAFLFLAAWLADRPGEVTINWLDYHVDTSVAVLIAVAAAFACVTILIWSLLIFAIRAPALLAQRRRRRRAARGQSAIAGGLVAIGAGDVQLARRFAAEARRFADGQPLQSLLQAQCAQLSGDHEAAEAAFRVMAERPDTRLFGLHGLFIEARRRGDSVAARAFAETAAQASPSLGWAGQAALDARCAEADWPGALDALERNREGGLVDNKTYRRQRAVLLTARALSLADQAHGGIDAGQRGAAIALGLEAVRLCPELEPAAVLAGRLLAQSGEPRKAERILEGAWRTNPHPDIASAYADLPPGAAARERLVRTQALARLAPGHRESALAVAQAALDANEFAVARTSLAPLLAAPTQRAAILMARLEEAEHGDIGRAREWMARAIHAAHDPAWTADGLIADSWMPVSPATGRLDAFQWRVPVAEVAPRGALIETVPAAQIQASPPPRLGPPASNAKPTQERPVISRSPATDAETGPEAPISLAASTSPDAPALAGPELSCQSVLVPAPRPAKTSTAVPAHAPDDPGPSSEPTPTAAPEPEPLKMHGWQAWFSRSERT